MLGTDFPYREFYPQTRQDRPGRYPPRESGRRAPRSTSVSSATSARPSALLPRLGESKDAVSRAAEAHYAKAREDLDELGAARRAKSRSIPSMSPRC